MKKRWIVVSLVLAVGAVLFLGGQALSPTHPYEGQSVASAFDREQNSRDDPASLWVVVNKRRPLQPLRYTPPDLVTPHVPLRQPDSESMLARAAVASALEKMFQGASAQGYDLMLASAYRSYQLQTDVYNSEVHGFGQAHADTESARPGYSEHQTGLAVDLESADRSCELEQCFADKPVGRWVAAHAHEYGFVLRYPNGKESVTGYKFEPWHLRYVGTELAAELHNQNDPTLEEFFDLPGGNTYR